MPLKSYGVLKCKPIAGMKTYDSAHYAVHTIAEDRHFRIAINVKSQSSPPELLYYIDEDFQHEICSSLSGIDYGFKGLKSEPGGLALDYIRQNLFDYHKMKVEDQITQYHNEMLDKFEAYTKQAIGTKDAVLYAFGQEWDNENKPDEYFGFYPGRGIHDIHMNQGNSGHWVKDDGPYQDGAIIINFPTQNKWVAIFTAFQSQSFHTDNENGSRIAYRFSENEDTLVIVSALVNPLCDTENCKTVSLLNTTAKSIDLTGWSLIDKYQNKLALSGEIKPGTFSTILIDETSFRLEETGGIITLSDNRSIKIHGVAYTSDDCREPGRTVKF